VSTDQIEEYERQRAIRRRHLLERQAVIFGSLIAALLALALIGLAVWFGAVPAPVSVPFATPPPENGAVAPPCPPADATPVPYGEITVNVYNGTTRGGLAAATAGELANRGLTIGARANDPYGRYSGATLVRAGPAGLAHAYTVAAIFPDALVQLDVREDASVDVTLGAAYVAMRPAQEAELDPALPIPAPAGCYQVPAPDEGEPEPA
jgi:hypothetical protein